ncbi:RHS repeat-associated core domain-containing protein, partial [Prevotella histicola]|uniref:RHS repeat-associated core domain-containing protein n=1 Tax=Prevotella histicola TaxID=470565 RepID=UPI00241C8D48
NRVTYTYGKAGDKYNRAGRLALVEDASGGEAYYYGKQGEVTKTVRTVMASVADIRTYVYGATYDSWNRVQTMTYPDGEVVTYHYNAAGQVESMTSNKQGRQSVIVDRIGYDKEGHTVYTKLGNGTETTYTYDKQRERLQVMNLTADGQTVMENRYRYDAVDNILGITNAANPTSLTKLNKAKLGGRSSHTYEYDELNRLIHANGKAKRASYDMVMSFGRMSEPLTKVQKVDSTTTAKSYNFAYKYEDSNHPTAPTQIGHDHYTYDANGNPTLVTNDSANTTREMYWDEDNRLMVLSDNGKTSRYTYNAAGERIMKSYGTMEGVYINGAPQGITFHETDNFTLYPASILSVNKNRFTKHYFIGDKRVASRIGTGMFNNVYGRNGSYVTAGQQDYAERMNQIQTQKEAYYKKVGVAPGVPTEKGAYGDPENTGVGYNAVLTELGNHDVPQGWIQTPRPNTTPGTNPGAPISWNDPTNPDDPQAGYGYVPNDTTKEETFFYHSDHLGSTSYITDDHANITQYDAYLPYGELLVDEHSSSEEMPYKFNGKQFDEETGLYYYGARYMNPMASVWYGVDPKFEKYINLSPYCISSSNPIFFIDKDGRDLVSAAMEGVTTFVMSAGIDFFVGLINTGNVNAALDNVHWINATKEAVIASGTSLIFSGVSTLKLINKLSKIRVGSVNLGQIIMSTISTMTSNIASKLANGEYDSVLSINWEQEFLVAGATSLLTAGLEDKADELLKQYKSAKLQLKSAKQKLNRNIAAGKNVNRLNSDANHVKIARSNTRSAMRKFARKKVRATATAALTQKGVESIQK